MRIVRGNLFEVNIFDERPDDEYGTGAIVDVAKVSPPMPKAEGRWNLIKITATGPQMSVMLNGVRTATGQDTKFANGPIAIQYSRGVMKFRKMQIKPL